MTDPTVASVLVVVAAVLFAVAAWGLATDRLVALGLVFLTLALVVADVVPV